MNTIAKQFGVQHLMPLQTARCIVMREPTVTYLESSADDDDENDHSSKPPQRSAQHSCHVVFKALRDNVDPYDYECDSNTDDDDDEYSNTSVEEEETSCSSSESSNDDDDGCDVATAHRTVRFGTPLVTATYTRPVTTTEEKMELYYTEREYREFRRQFGRRTIGRRSQQQHGSPTTTTTRTTTGVVVQFHVNVVTEIHETCHVMDNPSELYYSRTELQGFLDEFVASLALGM